MENELYHHGILGQKWGVRRFQNPDGTYTAAGRKRYFKDYKEHMTSIGENPSELSKETKISSDVKNKVSEDYNNVKKSGAKIDKLTKDYITNESVRTKCSAIAGIADSDSDNLLDVIKSMSSYVNGDGDQGDITSLGVFLNNDSGKIKQLYNALDEYNTSMTSMIVNAEKATQELLGKYASKTIKTGPDNSIKIKASTAIANELAFKADSLYYDKKDLDALLPATKPQNQESIDKAKKIAEKFGDFNSKDILNLRNGIYDSPLQDLKVSEMTDSDWEDVRDLMNH